MYIYLFASSGNISNGRMVGVCGCEYESDFINMEIILISEYVWLFPGHSYFNGVFFVISLLSSTSLPSLQCYTESTAYFEDRDSYSLCLRADQCLNYGQLHPVYRIAILKRRRYLRIAMYIIWTRCKHEWLAIG